MKLSIVTTIYESSYYINEFYERIVASAKKITDDYEIIFIDDGSPDDSLDILLKLHEKDSRIKVIELSRNFGHHKAMMVGLQHVKGDYVFLIDVDLEEEPENLTKLWLKMMQDKSIDVVYGIQKKRKTPVVKRFLSSIFYFLFNKLSSIKINKYELVSRLMTKMYVKALVSYREHDVFIPGLWNDVGFKQCPCLLERSYNGDSSYSLFKRISLAINAITSFSAKPLILIFFLGLIISSLSVLFIIFLMVQKLFLHIVLQGWTSLLISIYFLGGLILFSIGVVGIYLSKIFIESKDRPYAIVKSITFKEKYYQKEKEKCYEK